ncbi:MAG: amidase [Gemmatimonadetes bacterium]|nr:amidase [Gemmatimonadota bacterium]
MSYDLKSVKMPRLAGGALSALVGVIENGVGGILVGGKLVADTGIGALRASTAQDAPTFLPTCPFDGPAATPGERADLNELLRRTAGWAKPEGLATSTIADFHAAYQSARTTPIAVADKLLALVAENDKAPQPLKAFVALDADDVRAQAKASAARWAAGKPLGPLDGVPVAVKDEVDVQGYRTRLGTKALGPEPAAADCGAVAGLRRAGAIIVGKTVMQEIGMGVFGTNAHFGAPRNPVNPAHHTGGSSSGSGAAMGAGLVPVAVGADGGGSVRIPAAFCGGVGLKATFGRVSEAGASTICWTVGYVGPLANTARDALLGYAAMAGADPRDPASCAAPPVTFADLERDDLRGVRLGVYRPWFQHASSEIVAACEAQLQRFVQRGATVVEIEIPELETARVAHLVTITAEALASMEAQVGTNRAVFGDETRAVLALATRFNGADYVRAQRVRTRAIRHVNAALAQCDVVLTPATGLTAPAIAADSAGGVSDVSAATEIMRFAFLLNFTGHPAISFPVGSGAHDLPIAMQGFAQAWREDLLLRLAAVAERDVPRRAPAIRLDPLAG